MVKGNLFSAMKKEVSVLLATSDDDEDKSPIAVMETADKETLRSVVYSYLLPMYNWSDDDKDYFEEWIDNIVNSLYGDSYYEDFCSEIKMSLHTSFMY